VNYSVGQRMRVSDRPHDGHHRTPGYLKGSLGRVERIHSSFPNPETRAYGSDGLPEQPLYLVRFAQGGFIVYADVFEHWLEEAQ
jgi:nitrile hydratase subunit beta